MLKTTAGQNKACDCRKASLNGHHDHQYLDVTTSFTIILLQLFLKQSLPDIEIANQIYNNIAQAIRNMEMNSNNLTS